MNLYIKFTKSQYCVSLLLAPPTDRGRIEMNRGFWGDFQCFESKSVYLWVNLNLNFKLKTLLGFSLKK